jgi:ribosomal protein S18 acetylase RimI-like enzyme
MMELRPATPQDHAALVEICILTGHHGQDARQAYSDPGLLAEIHLLPYAVLEPRWYWALEDDDGLAGYIVGTPDTRTFARRAAAQCWPPLRLAHPLPATDDTSPQARLLRALHAGPTELTFLDSHPAHLHIDLLPRAQGHGWGSRLIAVFVQALQAHGVPGLHLGVSALNPGAIAFYRRQQFELLQETDWGLWMGRRW